MRLRPPAVPLITIDPYFSVWSTSDILTESDTTHWTGRPMIMNGLLTVDNETYRFMGAGEQYPAMKQESFDYDAFTSTYTFSAAGVRLKAEFTSPLLPDDFAILSRPVSYLKLSAESIDGKAHECRATVSVSEQICLDYAGECPVLTRKQGSTIRMGTGERNEVLGKADDDIRIDWGYFYLTADHARVYSEKADGMTFACSDFPFSDSGEALVTFAYDDIRSIEYFGDKLTSYWNRDGATISSEIAKARRDYTAIKNKCRAFSDKLYIDAVKAGGEKYAEILLLAFRQAIGGHKMAVDKEGQILFVSKECFSNGCAATVDISYPSTPLFLLYAPELIKGMMRPIIKYARSPEWKYDFAPHDAGRFPKLNGQVYRDNKLEGQMPVEECGNMMIMDAALAIAEKDASFALSHKDLLDVWVKYLIENGRDPGNQLCTDDFAGHLAHNCNLSFKAIMGIASYGIILGMSGDGEGKEKYLALARDMAKDCVARAANPDGSLKLAYDSEGTFSMKYNLVWDKLFGTGIVDRSVINSELLSYREKTHPYGLALDNRKPYTKSDWLVWTATLADNNDRGLFEEMITPLWRFYHYSPSRVPMTDWYMTLTGEAKYYNSKTHMGDGKIVKCFANRTVQGGLFIKLLDDTGKMKIK